jgi:hypothetical protein
VVESNSLDPKDRGSLSDDLRRMRDYRETGYALDSGNPYRL